MADPTNVEITLRLLAAGGLGAAIGLERELAAQPAGFRTHLLVSLGAALFTVAGTATDGDPARVAAQVVTGIGFLGAGAILRDRGNVRGLTTAASLWLAAAMGLACGFGSYFAACVSAAIGIVALVLLKYVERDFFPRRRGQQVTVDIDRATRIPDALASIRTVLESAEVSRVLPVEGMHRLALKVHIAKDAKLEALAQHLLDLEHVIAVDVRR